MHLPDRHFFPGMSFLSGILKRGNYLFILWLHSRNKKANNVGAKIKKNVAQVSYNDLVVFPKYFLAIAVSTNIAAVTCNHKIS